MNVNFTTYKENTNSLPVRKRQAFCGAGDVLTQGLRFLNVNEAIGATLVDFGFMAMPRTIVDSRRGFDAGLETGIRENSGTTNHALIGAVGGAAAYTLGRQFNKDYGVLSHSIFANNETIEILGKIWHENYTNLKDKPNELLKTFYHSAFEEMKGLNSCDGKNARWVQLQPETIAKLTDTMVKLSNDEKLNGKKIPKDVFNYLKNLIISDSGAEKCFRIASKDGKLSVDFAINSFLNDMLALGKAFSTEKVAQAFEASKNNFSNNKFISNLKGLKSRSALLALGISSAMGACVQPFNRWYTKKRTGKGGFVGVMNNPNAKSHKAEKAGTFITAKIAAAAGMLALCLSSITTNFKDIPNKIQFKGKIPTLNHFKFVYGFTIASRFLAARSSDELRESVFKDVLGFVNWLILGGFVSKGIVSLADGKNLLNSTKDASGKGWMERCVNWLKNKSVKTVDEVLQGDLRAKGVSTVTNEGKAIGFKQLLQKARELNMSSTLKKVKILGWAQLGGYLYSGLVLGILIPKLNIAMTNYNNRAEKNNSQKETLPLNVQTLAFKNNTADNEKVFGAFIK